MVSRNDKKEIVHYEYKYSVGRFLKNKIIYYHHSSTYFLNNVKFLEFIRFLHAPKRNMNRK